MARRVFGKSVRMAVAAVWGASFLYGLYLLYYASFRGLWVTVVNRDAAVMRAVTVRLRGSVYPLGDLAPGQSASVRVRTSGGHGRDESGVRVAYLDRQGDTVLLDAGGYISAGDVGDFEVEVKGGDILRAEGNTTAGILFGLL
jgi:hypothetical protein